MKETSKSMKKIISMVVILMMSLTLLTGCGADLTPAKEKFSEVETVFNEATELYNANGWSQDETMAQSQADLAASIAEMNEALDSPGLVTDSDVEEIVSYLDIILEQVKVYKETVALSAGGDALNLDALIDTYNQIVDLHSVIVDQAAQNGWDGDEEVSSTLTEVEVGVSGAQVILEDLDNIDGYGLTQADVDQMLAEIEGYVGKLNELKTKTATAK